MLCLSVSLVFEESVCCPIEIPILSAALLFLSIGHTRNRARSDDEKKIQREKYLLSF